MGRCLTFLLLCLAALPPVARAATLRIEPGPFRSGKAFLSCAFDGIKQSCFLDTGSAMTLLAESKHFSHYPNLGNFKFKSASGIAEEVETIQIRTATIDGVEFSNFKAGRVRPGVGIESTLGVDLVGRQPFSVNFHQSPSLHLNPKPPRAILTGLEVHAHRLLSLPVAFCAIETRAMWDTGASMTAVDEAFVKAHPDDFKATGDFMRGTDGAGHTFVVKAFRAKQMTIGSRTFRNVRVVVLDLSLLRASVSPQIDAIIGFNLIRKTDWFFDPQNKGWSIR